ncbi:hypothetical protein VTO42DRAFT_621 [Malbranchea cinnamomea]
MAILNDLEITIKLPIVNKALKETAAPANYQTDSETVPWAPTPREIQRYVTVPQCQAFEICVTLRPGFDTSLGDGLHFMLKVDDGQIVRHFYSMKFAEMDRTADGKLTKTIPSAIVQNPGGSGYRSILFGFGKISQAGVPQGYYDATRGIPPEGKILLTVIHVTHYHTEGQPMSIPPAYTGAQNANSSSQMM